MELIETRELSEWEGGPLPEGFIVFCKCCDEWSEPVVEIWCGSVRQGGVG